MALIAALARMALRDTRRRWQRRLALSAAALVLALVAVICLLAALGIGLAQITGPLAAALIMAAGAAVLALALGLLARRRPPPSGAAAAMEAEIARMARTAREEAAKLPPGLALGGAALAGLLLALALFRRR
jgi:cytochrome c biogenesis protein CcdA